MAHVIGPEGQLVIEKQIRDRLGVGPGWKVIQRLVDDHVELHFILPTQNHSLGGCLKPLIDPNRLEPSDEELEQAIESGFAEECREEEARIQADWQARQRASNSL